MKQKCIVVAFSILACGLGFPSGVFAQPEVLAAFGTSNGFDSWGRLGKAADGSLYGTTQQGGAHNLGTIFRLKPDGTLTTLHSFSGPDGTFPVSGLTLASDGNLYGVAPTGAINSAHIFNFGTIFRITPDGEFSVLHTFQSFGGTFPDGHGPTGPLVEASDGNLYGVASKGGTGGLVFRVSTTGNFSVVRVFGDLDQIAGPSTGLTLGPDGLLYGATIAEAFGCAGTLFRVSLAGAVERLHCFAPFDRNLGYYPHGYKVFSPVVFGADGTLYGTTAGGGAHSVGTIFKLDLALGFSVVHEFTGGSAGKEPFAGLARGHDGVFYGATLRGGVSDVGALFRFRSDTGYEVIADLVGLTGANPMAALLDGDDGALYGTTTAGGMNGRGTVFRYRYAAPPLCEPPAITSQPINQAMLAGAPVVLVVSASGTAPLSYQWFVGASGDTSTPVVGGSAPNVVVAPNATTSYWVRIENACGFVASDTVSVTVTTQPPPEICGNLIDDDSDGVIDEDCAPPPQSTNYCIGRPTIRLTDTSATNYSVLSIRRERRLSCDPATGTSVFELTIENHLDAWYSFTVSGVPFQQFLRFYVLPPLGTASFKAIFAGATEVTVFADSTASTPGDPILALVGLDLLYRVVTGGKLPKSTLELFLDALSFAPSLGPFVELGSCVAEANAVTVSPCFSAAIVSLANDHFWKQRLVQLGLNLSVLQQFTIRHHKRIYHGLERYVLQEIAWLRYPNDTLVIRGNRVRP